jgi:Fe-S oxidoreductase
MTTTYDPKGSQYLIEGDLREELTRVFDLCHGCRLCFNLCPSFPTLFRAVDAHDGEVSALSVGEQDQVVEECYQCKLCYIKCPYIPPHEWALDFPRLMMRAQAVHHASGKKSKAERMTDYALGSSDALGRLSCAASPLANAALGKTGSMFRKAMEATVGIDAERLLPPYAKERFTTWFKRRKCDALEAPRGEASVFPTCFIEYMDPGIGKDLLGVFERNEIACTLPKATKCCGAPWLHNGDIAHFERVARHNVAALKVEAQAGRDIIVAQPTCAYVIKKDYPLYAPGPDADLVAQRTFDAAEYLMEKHRSTDGGLDVDFPGPVPESVAYHLACHLRAQNIGYKGRDLLALTGTRVTLVERCSGIDGTWGYRAANYDLSRKVAEPLMRDLKGASADAVCGDCHLANTAILQETGIRPMHPIQLIARAYGIPEN